MDKVPVYISLKEIRQRLDRDRSTVWRWLRRKGIRTEGYSVSVLELRDKWPELYLSLTFMQPTPNCPRCSAPTVCSCSVCDFIMS